MEGEIRSFDVRANCPHCDEETEVNEDEFRRGSVECQHCEEDFDI